MQEFIGEFIGTMVLTLLGNGVVANVVLNKTKGNNSGWIVITAGWGFAVAMAVYIAGATSGAHINPAVTIGLLSIGEFDVNMLGFYLGGQFLGAFVGAILVFLAYYDHFKETEDAGGKLACFSTGPAIRNVPMNLITEFVGTAMLVLGVLGIGQAGNAMTPFLAPFLVGILVFSIGLSLGGPTGYAINPARDLGPRIMHAILPIPGKGDSDWGYSWIPVVGPILGGIAGAYVWTLTLGAA